MRDYDAIAAENRRLGLVGELSVVVYEQRRLRAGNRPDLAAAVEHVAVTRGDGLGYDVGSFELDGTPTFVEVKTTRRGPRTPFFLSRVELARSKSCPAEFRLYRISRFGTRDELFILKGDISEQVELRPETYRACF